MTTDDEIKHPGQHWQCIAGASTVPVRALVGLPLPL